MKVGTRVKLNFSKESQDATIIRCGGEKKELFLSDYKDEVFTITSYGKSCSGLSNNWNYANESLIKVGGKPAKIINFKLSENYIASGSKGSKILQVGCQTIELTKSVMNKLKQIAGETK